MKIRTALTVGTAALVTALALAGCSSRTGSGGEPRASMSGMDMGSSTSSASSSAVHNTADVMFAQMMIAHHMQAIEMSDMLLKKTGVNPKVTALANQIKAAQSPEIDQMNGFLTSWGQKTVTSSSGTSMSGMSGSGMMSSADMDKLDKATGAQASSLFLTQMMQHHSGAITMAQDEVKNGRDPRSIALANKIVTDQTAEIATMKQLLTNV